MLSVCSFGRQWSLRRGCGPRYPVVSPYHKLWTHIVVIILIISLWIPRTTAILLEDPPRSTETSLLVDTRIPIFVNGQWQIMSEDEHRQLVPRQPATQTYQIDVSTATAESTAAATSVASGPLPTPFDGALAANFSGEDGAGSCLDFINSFLEDPTFQSCYPLSLLLKGSNSFFQAMRSIVKITQVLETSCAANKTTCTSYLDNLAEKLKSDDNCGEDYDKQNALVVQAYKGMKAYEEIYGATCLTNPETSAYCFVNAVTNLTTASNVYLYNLPFNATLPSTALPACDYCTSETMKIYQSASADRSKWIANTYVSAAQQIDSECGATFVSAELPAALPASAATSTAQAPSLLIVSLLIMAISRWIL
ncbi:uncharacterized protein GGS22DRAFT_29515 [Annulohypoxylon maeteangense]|uniref:uncharacterized protein n=1 Tax=Annulohypoxylon maeteangense TaxID=1927788 RepID=UPI0020088043|nr:uncharacterized protein GGS22DRAFT_29515 [Annulohypoxylon maeteangense]KAI0883368.1 hypothetical protein GGS22DRAFT_29515 [Annulohypoxylon maeteangense]